ncbi:MAG: acyl carrier protein [Gammaproteobacteria bacterium]|uniref:Acyl carrier protein n=1 Tax=endosymbiont of Bathymodiolus septemdierum str. Myojin knoll TaxID=1303921 RepID=A0A0P0USP7_9GAMM|nr:phosphopantetheine-binding protein [Bathymodiolus septemdierum thioautotrophic gill symbiont]RUA06009.1 MAG: acyl carrier protein [Gammaproteobacteria bacterium]BAS68330.1 acyl carrier protein [endosymbiont of Bathymodiolus septemdierum str. Myojin knoll]
MSSTEQLESEIAELIVETLNLEDINASDINFDEPLFYDGLGLDSIDSLELSMALSAQYGFQLKSDGANNKEIFSSIRSLAKHVKLNKV